MAVLMAELSFDTMAKTLEESAYVVVGFGVLGFQRAQVRRVELQRHIGSLMRTVNSKMGDVSEDVAELLPKEVTDFFHAAAEVAHDLPREAEETVKELVAIGRLVVRLQSGPGQARRYP